MAALYDVMNCAEEQDKNSNLHDRLLEEGTRISLRLLLVQKKIEDHELD